MSSKTKNSEQTRVGFGLNLLVATAGPLEIRIAPLAPSAQQPTGVGINGGREARRRINGARRAQWGCPTDWAPL
eukprot:6941858-Pyramimonas_sp.AAC.1